MTFRGELLGQSGSSLTVHRKVTHWWLSLTAAEQARLKVVTLVSLVVVAFHYSLSSLITTLGYETPLAYVGLVPLIAGGLAWIHRVPRTPEPPIHDRQLDYIVGLPLVIGSTVGALELPRQMGLMYWFDRVDLLLLPVFLAGSVVLLFGFRTAWRQKLALAYLFLAWPWPYQHILLGTLDGFTNVTLAGLRQALKIVPVGRPVTGTPGLFEVVHKGHSFPISVVTACSGVDGIVGFLLIGVAFAGTVGGGRVRKAVWLGLGLVLLWTTNLFRLLLIFWVGSVAGENIAINILHPVAGLIVFCVGVALMVVLLKPFGLTLKDIGPRSVPRPVPQHRAPAARTVLVAAGIVSLTAFVLCVKDSDLRAYNPVASAAGEPKLSSYLADPAAPPGWTADFDTEFFINKPLFGQSSRWFRYIYVATGAGPLHSSLPVTADVIDAGGLTGFDEYGVEACYTFHGYTLRDDAKVDLGDGITGQALSYGGKTVNTNWSIVYWIWPVETGTGTRYERIILYLQNTDGGSVSIKGMEPDPGGTQSPTSSSDPQQDRLMQNRTFLVAFARSIVAGQMQKKDQSVDVMSLTGGARTPYEVSRPRTEPVWVRLHQNPPKSYAPTSMARSSD